MQDNVDTLIDQIDKASRNGSNRTPMLLHSPRSVPREIHWVEQPPDPETEDAMPATPMLRELKELIQDYPLRVWRILFDWSTRAVRAAQEYVAYRRLAENELKQRDKVIADRKAALRSEIDERKGEKRSLENEQADKQKQLSVAMNKAGLEMEGDEASAEAIERSIRNATPTLNDFAGRHGILPPGDSNRSWIQPMLSFLFGMLSPMMSGFVLALTLGTLLGLVSLTDLQRGDRFGLLALCGCLGCVIVWLMGEIVAHAMDGLARVLETRKEDVPGFRRMIVPVVVEMAVLCVLACAEICVEAYGLQELHNQHNLEILRLNPNARLSLLPLLTYVLMGTLVSGPYLGYKLSKILADRDASLREAWLLEQQRVWVESKRAEAEVQNAFAFVVAVRVLRTQISETDESIKKLGDEHDVLKPLEDFDEQTRERLDSLYLIAAAETAIVRQQLNELVERKEPFPSGR